MEDVTYRNKFGHIFLFPHLKINPLHYSKAVLPKFTLVMPVDKFLLLFIEKKNQQIFMVCSLCARNFIGRGVCRGELTYNLMTLKQGSLKMPLQNSKLIHKTKASTPLSS